MGMNKTKTEGAAPVRRHVGRPRKNEFPDSVADLLLRATINEVARDGAFAVNARQVCDVAGVSYGTVNHNFVSWNGLLAAAAMRYYSEYVEELWKATQAAPHDPDARLEAWIKAQVAHGVRMAGWSAVINYPATFKSITDILQEKHAEEMTGLLELNLARLGRLTLDVRDGVVTDFPYGVNEFPREEMLADHVAVARATITVWGTLGMTIWMASATTRGAGSPETGERGDMIMDFHIAEIIRGIKSDAH